MTGDDERWTFERDRRLIERLPVGVFRSTLDGRFVDVNPAFVSLLGAESRSDLKRHDAGRFYADPDVRDRLVERVERNGTVSDEEVELVTLDGDRIWVSTTLMLSESDDGVFLEGVSQEITSRKERERESRRYQGMVDAMQDSACIYDADGRFVVVNDYLADFYGTTKEALVGEPSPLVEQLRTEAADEPDPFQRLVDGEIEEFRGEHETEFPDHGHAIVDYRLTRLTVDGAFEGVVAVGREVTERNRRERALERTNDRLDAFVSIVSHDLRNPLGVAEGRLELAREECDSDHLDHVDRAHDRMQTLIEDLLTLARESGPTIEPVSVDLADLVETSWRNVQGHDAELVVESASIVRADRQRLQQLLENLFRNAVEHGGDAVTITVGDLADGFYVADDGPGFPGDDRERLFERGYSTREEGTGFGLAIVESVAASHGWDVAATDGDDGGARIEVTGVDRVA
jgi:PAS domain S-box-containing protein